jgi:hypothetical protein
MATVRTLGEAYSAGWAIRMRCQRGDQRGIVKIDACRYETEWCLKTLVTTRGRDFPLARITDPSDVLRFRLKFRSGRGRQRCIDSVQQLDNP